MTRFQRELRGDLGAFWQQHAQGELAKVKADLESPQDEAVLDYLLFEFLVGHVRILRFVFFLSVVY